MQCINGDANVKARDHLLHGELPQRRHGGERLLNDIFYVGNGKWLNALQFLQVEKSTSIGSRLLKASEFPLCRLLSICFPLIIYFPT